MFGNSSIAHATSKIQRHPAAPHQNHFVPGEIRENCHSGDPVTLFAGDFRQVEKTTKNPSDNGRYSQLNIQNMDTITVCCHHFQKGIFSITITTGKEEYRHEWQYNHDIQTEALLEYYFETYIIKPYDDVIVKRAPEIIKQYGEDLYQGIFPVEIARQIEANKDKTKLVIEVVSDLPPFQALYWESMKPAKAPPLAQQGVIFRRKVGSVPIAIQQNVEPYPAINLLIVTCRPDEEHDVNQRTVQRPVVELLDSVDAKVNIHILRPGTYDAFIEHLKEKKGYYHLLHFDLHGALLDYETYSKRHLFAVGRHRSLQGLLPKLGEDAFHEGERAFVFFETQTKGIAAPVDAIQLAEVLTEHQVVIAIINACQSAKQDHTENETSLASILAKRGLALVLAMRYSVSVTAVQVFMKKLYEQLYQGVSFESAIAAARLALIINADRQAMFNKSIQLEDWILPVVYRNREITLNLRPFYPGEVDAINPKTPNSVQQNLAYDFVGRDLDILKIEKALLTKNNILLLQSMGGGGKTTLLKYLAAWWLKTGLVSWAFYYGYDVKRYFLEEMLLDIAKSVFTKEIYDWYQQMNSSREELERDIIEFLSNHPCALILDNTEAITGEKLAIKNTLPEIERLRIKNFIAKLRGSQCFVLIGSRAAEDWLKEETFRDNHYLLKGLDGVAAMSLVESILAKNGLNIDNFSNDSYFEQLIKLLDGSPLALKAVLPNLKKKPPKQILTELSAGIRDLDEGNIQQKTESIIHCIEYAYNNLSEEAQNILLFFAPFTGVINLHPGWIDSYFDQAKVFFIISYTSLGKSFEDQKIFYPEEFNLENVYQAFKEAIQNGLMQELIIPDRQIRALQLQPVFAYFLRLQSEDQLEIVTDYLNGKFIEHFYNLSETYNEWINSDSPEQQQRGIAYIELDYENLYKALLDQLKAKSLVFALVRAIDGYLTKNRRHVQRLELMKLVESGLQKYEIDQLDDVAYLQHVSVLESLAEIYFEMHDYEQMKQTLRLLGPVAEKSSLSGKEKALIHAHVHQRNGECALATGDIGGAEVYFKEALSLFRKHKFKEGEASARRNLGLIFLERENLVKAEEYLVTAFDFFQRKGDFYSQAILYEDAGRIYEKAGFFDQAIQYYQNALHLFEEFGHRFNMAGVYVNLGYIFQRQALYLEARELYLHAIEIYEQYQEWYHQAKVFSELGDTAHKQMELEEAEGYYQKALTIFIGYKDEFRQGQTLQNLGVLYMDRGADEMAFIYFQEALSIFEKQLNVQYQAKVNYNLGNYFSERKKLKEAKEHYARAISLAEQTGDFQIEAMAYYNLGAVFSKAKNFQYALPAMRKALSIFETLYDKYHIAKTYESLGDIAIGLGEYEGAMQAYIVAFIDKLELHNKSEIAQSLIKIKELVEMANDENVTQEFKKVLSEAIVHYPDLFN